jgi:hypothetical protein
VVRTTVGAVSSTYAAVVDLNIHALVVVICREHRADRLARSVSTLLAKNRNEASLHVWEITFPVPLNANPRVNSLLLVEVFSVQRNIVLYLTGKNTRLTTGTTVDIDHHAPVIWTVLLGDHLL